MKIHAWAATVPKSQLEAQEYEVTLEPGQVAIEVMSCSLTRGDVRFIDNYWGDSKYPLVAGYEVIGKVLESAGSQPLFAAGDIVGVGYQVGACFACEYCRAGKEQFCLQQRLIPAHARGGLADRIIVDQRFVFHMPSGLQGPEATPLLDSGLTVFSAIMRAQLGEKLNVGVIGLGSLGHLAVQFLAQMGPQVTVFTHTPAKASSAREFGAAGVILDAEQVPGREFDFILSCASDGVDWQRYIRALRPEGTLAVVGLPSEPVIFRPELLADYASRRIQGNYIGSRADMEHMLAFAADHHITARAKIYPMSEINKALADMRRGTNDFSTVLIKD